MRLSTNHLVLALTCFSALSGCRRFGSVNQGQVIDYRAAAGTITLISDSNYRDPEHPRFDVLPPVTIRVPENPSEMGPEPQAGKLLLLDWRKHLATIFDARTQSILACSYTPISEEAVEPSDPRVRRAKLPAVDRVKKTITTYWAKDRKLVVFSVPEEYSALPDDTWRVGDQVRYYFKDPGCALRLMNVTRTDLNKAGE